jgi:intein/homing endonuclease
MTKTILSLCDYTGNWAKPYADAGYKTILVDLKHGQDVRLLEKPQEEIYGILAAPPCFEPGTLIKTNNGLEKIENVQINGKVLTHLYNYKSVYNISKIYVKELVELSTLNNKKLKVTKEHPFYVMIQTKNNNLMGPFWIKAQDLNKDCYIGSPIIPFEFIDDKIKSDWNNLPINDENFWWLVGCWLGDGWCTKHNRGYEIHICCGLNSTVQYRTIVDKYKNSNYSPYISKQNTTYRFTLYNKELFLFLKLFGDDCYNKKIPEFIFNLPINLLKSLLEGYLFADGSVSKENRRQTVSSVSKELIFGISLLIQKVYQKCPSFQINKVRIKSHSIDGRLINNNQSYSLTFYYENIIGAASQPHSFVRDNIIWNKVKSINNVIYNDYVYNLSVEDDESYIANNLICHNCTVFSAAGARWKRTNEEMIEGLSIVDACIRIILSCKPKFWALENPVGKLVRYLGKPKMYFQPCDYGDDYTKKTCLWGEFNIPVKNPVVPIQGSKMWAKYGGKSDRTKELRSITPMGFAKAFFESNK